MGLLHILPKLGKSGGHIPHSSSYSSSLRLAPFLSPFLRPRVEAAVFCWRSGDAQDPRGGTFGGAERVGGRGAQTLVGAASGGRRWLIVLSGIQEAASTVHRGMGALPRYMDLGNYWLV